MVGRRAYDLMYRWWAPWDAVGVRPELRHLLADEIVSPDTHPRAIDLGCGTGANVVYLAEQGFRPTGVDFSPVALAKARERAVAAGVASRCQFVEADLTADALPTQDGPYDLLLDFGTIDDIASSRRPLAARLAARLARPGGTFLFWCFYGRREDLPRISFHGPSRVTPGIEPDEVHDLFSEAFDIERYVDTGLPHTACFLLTRRADPLTPSSATTPTAHTDTQGAS
jgi:SAM-dependent methyltransferase